MEARDDALSQAMPYRMGFALTWVALVSAQALMTWTLSGFACAGLAMLGALVGLKYTLAPGMLTQYPISTAMLLGYVSYYFLLPAVVTTIEGKPLTNNLDLPVEVHFHAFVVLIALVMTHSIYRSAHVLQVVRHGVEHYLYRPIGYFSMPSATHLYAIGFVGLAATAHQIFVEGAAQQEALGSLNKLMQAMYPLAYVPYALLLRQLVDGRRPALESILPTISAYTVVLLGIGMGRNSRAAVLIGLTSIALAWGYLLIIQPQARRAITPARIGAALLLLWALGGPVSDLATSMVIAREQRDSISAMDLIAETAAVFTEKDRIATYRKIGDGVPDFLWDEHYVDNLFAARLCNLKFADSTLSLAYEFDAGRSAMLRGLEWQRTLGVLPRPVLEWLSLEVDKDFVNSASGGDLLLYVATGAPEVVGGFRTGSLFGSGYATFGWVYVPVLMLSALLVFPLADANTSRLTVDSSQQSWTPVFSPFALVGLFAWFYYFTSAATGIESLSNLTQYLIRGWLQGPGLYIVVFWATAFPIRTFAAPRDEQ